ncbi:MAG: hypothetical protein JRJ87_08400 [Deltaproteobacteria bacterium]|nr:hypothetical protein [Deltaproteobacteria bacterium]
MLSKIVKHFADRIQKLEPDPVNLHTFYEQSDEFVKGQFADMLDLDYHSVFGLTLQTEEKWHW